MLEEQVRDDTDPCGLAEESHFYPKNNEKGLKDNDMILCVF